MVVILKSLWFKIRKMDLLKNQQFNIFDNENISTISVKTFLRILFEHVILKSLWFKNSGKSLY